jgi:hypothetical protein
VGKETKLDLAIRTILITTRAAVRSNQAAGRDGLALESARKGEELLNELGSRLAPGTPAETLRLYDAARDGIQSLAADASHRAVSVDGEEGALDEEVDVRSELGT